MAFPCQVLQRRMAIFAAQPFGPGLFLCDAALLVAYLDDQTSLLVPCFAQKQAPARPRPKRQQTLRKTWFFCSSRLLQDARGRACAYLRTRPVGSR
ncbi:MAG TPA: hypothetical protein DIC26_08640 [Pseudomonas sp.]|nr:hypothetical protein [Pseudomonas sp.]